MNKIAKLMCLVAFVALIGTSCKKQEEKVWFSATLPELQSEDKLYLVGKKLWFEVGDQVRMFNVKNEVYGQSDMAIFAAKTEGLTTTFEYVSGDITPTRKDAFFAYFPGEAAAVTDFMDNSGEQYGQYGEGHQVPNYVCFKLQPKQEYRVLPSGDLAIPAMSLYCAAKNETAGNITGADFTFDYIGGVLSLKFYNNGVAPELYMDSIKVTDKRYFLCGNVFMRIDRVDPAKLARLFNLYDLNSMHYMQELNQYVEYVGYRVPGYDEGHTGNAELSTTLTLTCPSVKLGKTKADATPFIMGIRPLALLQGFTIDAYLNDGNGAVYHYYKTTDANCKVEPGMVRSISALKMTTSNTTLVP